MTLSFWAYLVVVSWLAAAPAAVAFTLLRARFVVPTLRGQRPGVVMGWYRACRVTALPALMQGDAGLELAPMYLLRDPPVVPEFREAA